MSKAVCVSVILGQIILHYDFTVFCSQYYYCYVQYYLKNINNDMSNLLRGVSTTAVVLPCAQASR